MLQKAFGELVMHYGFDDSLGCYEDHLSDEMK
jgi:hypothetical protein